jgi:Icc protein
MSDRTKDEILHNHGNDGIERRGFLKCMAWAGTGIVWATAGSGIPVSRKVKNIS